MTRPHLRKRSFRLPWRSARQIRADVDDELAFHLDMRVNALVASGLSHEAAAAQAAREFGDIEDARRYIGAVDRDIEAAQRRSDLMTDLWQDVAYAVRKLRASPAFTLAAILTLALGIGANTAIFSVVHTVLLEPLPFPHADHLVRFKFSQQGHADGGTPMDLVDYRTQASSLSGVAVMEGATANLTRENGDAERLLGVRVSANWFDLLRVKPLHGGFFRPEDDRPGGRDVVVLSEELWRRDFSGDPAIIGKSIRINATPFTVTGVLPAGLRYPVTAELWMPKRFVGNELSDQTRGARWLGVLARVKDGVSVAAADAEVTRISKAMERKFPEDYRERRANLVTAQDLLVGDMRKPLYVILGAVVLVLVIACANVANLLLVRSTARESEIAIRTALGASRGRLARQLMTESLILAVVGAAAGIGIAKIGMATLLARAPQSLVLIDRATIDATTLIVMAIVAVLTSVVFGTLPAMHATNPELATTLRAGGRGARNRHTAHRTKRAIVVAELSLAVMLLSGAGLLLHSFARLIAVDPGFTPEGVLSMKISLPAASYDSAADRNFVRTLITRVRALPGVQAVGVGDAVPLDGTGNNFSFTIRGRSYARPSDQPSAETRVVTPDFFKTLGIPLLRGRALDATDDAGAPHVFVVNEAFAKRFFPNENVVDQAIRVGWARDPTTSENDIVGVVGSVRGEELGEDPLPTVYASYAQYPVPAVTLLVRTSAPPASLAGSVRAVVRSLDHELPVYSVQSMADRVASSVGAQRFYATLIALFAGVALVLAAVGLYGVIAYAVGQRSHELGVRVALGATREGITRMVIGEGLTLTAVGVVVALTVVATLASWLPARRAARIDPLVAMRGE